MVDTLGLEDLYTNVVAAYTAAGSSVVHYFGWREPVRLKQEPDRVVWVPGDQGGVAGTVEAAIRPGRNPRPLANFKENFTVYITGHDPTKREDELAQWKAARLLFDEWFAYVYRAAYGSFAIRPPSWDVSKNERRHGATMIVVGTIDSMVPDLTTHGEVAPTKAQIPVTTLDTTEIITIDPTGYIDPSE